MKLIVIFLQLTDQPYPDSWTLYSNGNTFPTITETTAAPSGGTPVSSSNYSTLEKPPSVVVQQNFVDNRQFLDLNVMSQQRKMPPFDMNQAPPTQCSPVQQSNDVPPINGLYLMQNNYFS